MKWKTTAIIFIILFFLETLFVITSLLIASHIEKAETTCMNKCVTIKATGYLFDQETFKCSCLEDNQIIYEEAP